MRRSLFAAALREGFTGPLFIQGDHVQTNAKKYNSPERDKELETLRALIREEIAAGFYNIDIDTSTLVDLDKPTLAEQQEVNVTLAADFAAFIRRVEPAGVTVSVGGEIGEVGGKNSDVHELHAYMEGFNAKLKERGNLVGLSKISVQTGTAHGGFINADGIGAEGRRDRSEHARGAVAGGAKEYGLGGAVQHGASTLPLDAFDAFPRVGACEIHLATDFQNMVYEHPQFPAGPEGRDVRLAARARDRGTEAEGHRRAVHLQGAQEGHRSLQEPDVGHRRRPPRRHRRSRSRSASRS